MTHDHDALRKEFQNEYVMKNPATDQLGLVLKLAMSADWWIAKLEAQSARHREELESIAKEIERDRIRYKGSKNTDEVGSFNNAIGRAAAVVRTRIGA